MAHIVLSETKVTASFEFVQRAVHSGHQVTFVCYDLAPYLRGAPIEATLLSLAREVIDGVVTSDPTALCDVLRKVAETHPVDALLTLSEPHLSAVATAAARLGLPHEDPATVAVLRDKYQVRQQLASAGVPQPKFCRASTVAEAVAAADEIGYPVVVKPIDGSGSINVGIARDAAEAAAHARTVMEHAGYGRSVASRRVALIEQFIDGPVVSCEMLTVDGKHQLYGCTDRVLSNPPWTVELGGCFPAEFAELTETLAVCSAALTALGVSRGISHTELVLSEDGPQIIEVNGRLVGGYIPEMMSMVLDRDVYQDLIDLYLGKDPVPPRATGVACIRALVAPNDGVLETINIADARGQFGVAEVVLDCKPGDAVRRPRSNRDRLGFVVTTASDADTAIAFAEHALESVKLDVRPSPHIVILAGAGGISLDYVLNSAITVTDRLSVVYLHAWSPVDVSAMRTAWHGRFRGTWRDCATVDEAYDAVREIHAADRLAGIATYSEFLIQPQADLADELSLPGNPPDAVRTAQNKLRQREVMRSSGALPLRFHPVRDATDLAAAAAAVGFPSIFKPAYGAASMQVSKVNNIEELTAAFQQAVAAKDKSPFLIKEDLWLLEELLVGAEGGWHAGDGYADYVSVESLVQDGQIHHLGVVDKLALQHGYVEEGDVFPSVLGAEQVAAVQEHVSAIISAVGLRNGAVHTEIKLTADGPRCIEINARLGGPMGHIFAAASDHDIVASTLRIAAGIPIDPTVTVERAVCFRSIPGPTERVRVTELAEPKTIKEQFECVAYCRTRTAKGKILEPGGYPHIATILVTGKDIRQCLANIEMVEKALGASFAPVDREHVTVIDRVGWNRYRMPDGSPALDPARYRVTLVTRPELVYQVRQGECAEVIGANIFDDKLRDELCATIHRQIGTDWLLVFTERLLVNGARFRERHGLQGPAVAQVLPFRDKSVMKKVAFAAGLEVADGCSVDDAEQALPLLAKYGKIVLKPTNASGSAGVFVVENESQLHLAANECVSLTDYQAEEFMDAEMLHIDMAVYEGQIHAFTVSRYLSSTLSQQNGQPLISVMVGDPMVRERARREAERVIEGFGARNSVLHLEVFERADGTLVFNEVACRNGGAGVVPAMQAVTGVNLYEAMVRLSVGEPPTSTYPLLAKAAGWLVLYARRGRFVSVADDGIPQEWLALRQVAAQAGDLVEHGGFSGTGLVTYAVIGDTEQEVRQRLDFIKRNVSVRYEDTEDGQ